MDLFLAAEILLIGVLIIFTVLLVREMRRFGARRLGPTRTSVQPVAESKPLAVQPVEQPPVEQQPIEQQAAEEKTAPPVAPPRPPSGIPYLEMRSGSDPSIYYPLTAATTTIGRDPTCDIVLGDALSAISRRHAQIEHMGDAYILMDLNSSNGVFVDGVAVRRNRLRDGVEISIGRVAAFIFRSNDPGGGL